MRRFLALLLASSSVAAAQTASFDSADGYRVGAAVSDQPAEPPSWTGTPLATVIDLGDGNGAAQTSGRDETNFANMRLPLAGEATGKVPFSFRLRSDAKPTSEDFDGAWFVRIGHDTTGNTQGNAVRIGIFDNGIVQTENQAGGGISKMVDADGKTIDLDDFEGRFVDVSGVIDFGSETYTLTFDGVEQTFQGKPELPFHAAGQDELGVLSINAWNSDDQQARQVTFDDFVVGDADASADASFVKPDERPLPTARPRPAGDDLPGGVAVLPQDAVAAFFAGNYGPVTDLASVEVVDVAGGPVDRALRVTVGRNTAAEPQKWHAEIKTRQIAPTTGGDVAHLRFWARTLASEHETAAAEFDVYYQHAGRPFDPSFVYRATPGSEWTRYDIPFNVYRTYGEGNAELNFAAGLREQTFELAGIELVRYGGTGVELSDLPKTTQDYDGRDPDAAWRKEALARIDELRTGPIEVRVVDADGRPVAGERIEIEMTKSAFQFGSAISAEVWRRQDDVGQRYREEALRLFNTASTENGLKIHRWYDLQHRQETMAMLADLDEAGLTIHGHVLVWPSWRKTRVPLDRIRAEAEAGDVESLRWITNEFIRDVTIDTAQYIDAWDVMNEPWNNNDFMRLMGESEMAEWFQLAEKHRPDADLFINDFGILNGPPFDKNGHAQEYHRVIQVLADAGAPVDAIGFQSHFGSLISIGQLQETIAAFEPFGKRMMITEFDTRTTDAEAYADYLRDLLILSYAHPQFDGFIMWGFWDEVHWLRNTPMFARDWTAKPGVAMWEKWVLGEWKTNTAATTDDQGIARVTGHHGGYVVRVGDVEMAVSHTAAEPGMVVLRLN
ncbi:MAG: endo-1,4-beta-xylanase [Planctomycetota bacterium]